MYHDRIAYPNQDEIKTVKEESGEEEEKEQKDDDTNR